MSFIDRVMEGFYDLDFDLVLAGVRDDLTLLRKNDQRVSQLVRQLVNHELLNEREAQILARACLALMFRDVQLSGEVELLRNKLFSVPDTNF